MTRCPVVFRPVARRLAAPIALALLSASAARGDVPPLGREPQVTEGIIAAAIAYEIGDKCEGVDARILRGIAFLNGLRSVAARLGYSRAEIEAYIDDDAEKDRLEAVARDRLAAMGGVEGEWDTYCAVGREEIAKGSQIGVLLDD